jgi:hypothetical protein
MCPYWWDRLKGVPDSMGRDGWFEEPYSDNLVAIIMPETLEDFDDIRDLDNEDISAVHFPISQVVRYIDGSSKSSEMWLPIDNNGDIIYDLTPPEMVDDIKNAYGKGLNESEEDDWKWVDDIPDPYDKVDTSQDYVGEWEHFKPSFYKACIDIKGGKVVSSDYSGYIRIELDTANQGKLRFFIDYRYIDDGPEPFVEVEWLVYKNNLLLQQSKNRDDAEGGLYGPIKKFIEEKLNACGKGLNESEEGEWGWVEDVGTPLDISTKPSKIWVLDLPLGGLKKIYDYLLSIGFKENIGARSLTRPNNYNQKIAYLILNVDNRVYFGDDEVEALERGEEKPKPQGEIGFVSLYSDSQLEHIRGIFNNEDVPEINAEELLGYVNKK